MSVAELLAWLDEKLGHWPFRIRPLFSFALQRQSAALWHQIVLSREECL